MTTEKLAMRGPPLLDSVLERAGNVVLADDIGELLRAVFTRENLVAHGKEMRRLYVMSKGFRTDQSVQNPGCSAASLGLTFCWLRCQ